MKRASFLFAAALMSAAALSVMGCQSGSAPQSGQPSADATPSTPWDNPEVQKTLAAMPPTLPTDGKFQLFTLPYAPDALEPVISSETVGLHHGKHLQGYVNNLNAAIAGTELEGKSLEEIVARSSGGVFNNAGQALNHNLYFGQFRAPREGAEPQGRLRQLIDGQYGGFEVFKQEFEKAGASLFGSGWVWLSVGSDGKLAITQEANGGNPLTRGLRPLMGIDVWEHAYYVDYRNRRADHLAALWSIIDWEIVGGRLGN